jgi:hypothetical protein
MKVCNRCKLEKELNKYWTDSRRKDTDFYHQQPCIDCRNEQRKIKRKIDFSNNYISSGKISYNSIRRYCTGLKKDYITDDLIDFVRQNIFLKRELNKKKEKLLYEKEKLFCRNCNSIVFLPKESTIFNIEKIIFDFKKIHEKC